MGPRRPWLTVSKFLSMEAFHWVDRRPEHEVSIEVLTRIEAAVSCSGRAASVDSSSRRSHEMTSALTWLDVSAEQQRRVREILRLFEEPGTRDELGIGPVRDSFS